jgi:hypothetical protein
MTACLIKRRDAFIHETLKNVLAMSIHGLNTELTLKLSSYTQFDGANKPARF